MWVEAPGGQCPGASPSERPDPMCPQGSHMRGTMGFVIALCLTFVGSLALIYLLLFADGWRGWMVTGAGLVLAVGVVWLYHLDAMPNQQWSIGHRSNPSHDPSLR